MMRGWSLITVIGVSAALVAMPACEDEEPDVEPANGTTFEDLERETGEAFDAAKDWSAEKKNEFTTQLNERLTNLDDEMGEFASDVEELGDEAAARWNTTLEELREQRAEVAEKMSELKDATGDAWAETKEELDDAYEELKQAYNDAKNEFDREYPDIDNGGGGG